MYAAKQQGQIGLKNTKEQNKLCLENINLSLRKDIKGWKKKIWIFSLTPSKILLLSP